MEERTREQLTLKLQTLTQFWQQLANSAEIVNNKKKTVSHELNIKRIKKSHEGPVAADLSFLHN